MKPPRIDALLDGINLGAAPDEERVFSAPWEARAFAVALALSEAGYFSWDFFRARLIEQVAVSDRVRERDGTASRGEYYEHFLRALEQAVAEAGLASPAELARKIMEIEAGT